MKFSMQAKNLKANRLGCINDKKSSKMYQFYALVANQHRKQIPPGLFPMYAQRSTCESDGVTRCVALISALCIVLCVLDALHRFLVIRCVA